jgi:hypothetical protein
LFVTQIDSMPECERGGSTVIQNDVGYTFDVAMASNGY